MSYRSNRAPKKDAGEKQQEKFYAILEKLLKVPGNEMCVDCGIKGPRWASVNLGLFVCIRCSGIHRHIGTHITKVKSVSLDKWTPENIEMVRKVGNTNARRIFEARLPANYHRPRESDQYGVEQWIRDKYERKRWFDPAVAAEVMAGRAAEPAAAAPAAQPAERQRKRLSGDNSGGRQKQQSRTQAAPAAAPTPSLIDMPAAAPAPAAAGFGDGWSSPAAVQVPSGDQGFFSDFVSAPTQQTQQATQSASFFDQGAQPQAQQSAQSASFFQQGAAQPQAQQQQQQQAGQNAAFFQQSAPAPKASKADILSLFKQPNAGMGQMGGMGMNQGMNQMGGMGMNNMGMNNVGMNNMGMQNNQMGMNNMGMQQNMGMQPNMGMGMNNQMAMQNNMGMGMQNNNMNQMAMQNNMGMQQNQQNQAAKPFFF